MKKIITLAILSLSLIACDKEKGVPIITSVKYSINPSIGKYFDEITIGSESVTFWTDSLYHVGDVLTPKR